MKKIWILACCLACVAPARSQSERPLIRDGNRSYKDSKFPGAEVNYRKALEKNNDLVPGTFDLGDALYKQGRYGEAAGQYGASAQKLKDPSLKAQALHNLGNALLKEQKLPESIGAYKAALKVNPNDADTKYNLEYAKALLQRQQQQQQQNKDQKKDDKKKQDQQKQDQQKKDEQKQDQQKNDEQKEKDQKNDQQQKQQAQQKKQQISKEDAERILEALKNEEKNVQKKLHRKVPARVKVEKDW